MDTTWIMPALDVIVIAMLAAVLWRLRRDPSAEQQAAWQERERRLEEIFERLRLLVAQSEGVARDLDGALGGHEERLRALLGESAPKTRATAAMDARPERRGAAAAAEGRAERRVAANAERAVDGRAERRVAAAAERAATAASAQGAAGRVPSASAAAEAPLDRETIARVRSLAAASMPIEEIARRVDMLPAEVRVLVGLHADDRAHARRQCAAVSSGCSADTTSSHSCSRTVTMRRRACSAVRP